MRAARLAGLPRRFWQLAATAAANGYWPGFARGTIYQGPAKKICLPFLNCYSCPGALGACPVGSAQAILAGPVHAVPLYVLGVLMAVGVAVGRAVCGWLCPFGLLQEVLARPRARRRRLPGWLLGGKYVVLALTVALPVIWLGAGGIGAPYFCKYLCPAGTLEAAVPLLAADASLRALAGPLLVWKLLVLAAFLIAMVFVYRPFCRVACPLGAFYSLLNPVSIWRLERDRARCIGCGACRAACPLDLPVDEQLNGRECVRCLECTRACPSGALSFRCGPASIRSSVVRPRIPG
ncbi:MAG: 4Fe-4S binding protein [Bacillota bacterium]|nr:4Fe-4S binding protein [Bacillota bacterium]